MIDWHCHLLPTFDDGPATIEESIAMAALLQQAGFNTVYCTPHLIKGAYEAGNQAVRSSISILQARLQAENIGLEILPGREYYLDEFLLDYLKNPLPLGRTHFIMIEIPNHAAVEFVKNTCFRIKRSGFIPLIAHPERCNLFATIKEPRVGWLPQLVTKNSKLKTQNSTLLDYLREIDCAFQGNLCSFEGRYGEEVRQTATQLKAEGVYTHYGTDLHSRAGLGSKLSGRD